MNLETLDQKSEDEQDKAGEHQPEGEGGEHGETNIAEEAQDAQEYSDPECNDFGGSKFHFDLLYAKKKEGPLAGSICLNI
jgi:hypothetical protein